MLCPSSNFWLLSDTDSQAITWRIPRLELKLNQILNSTCQVEKSLIGSNIMFDTRSNFFSMQLILYEERIFVVSDRDQCLNFHTCSLPHMLCKWSTILPSMQCSYDSELPKGVCTREFWLDETWEDSLCIHRLNDIALLQHSELLGRNIRGFAGYELNFWHLQFGNYMANAEPNLTFSPPQTGLSNTRELLQPGWIVAFLLADNRKSILVYLNIIGWIPQNCWWWTYKTNL